MLNSSKTVAAATGALLLSLYLLPAQEAHAGRFFARGANGAAGGVAGRNQYGGGAAGFAAGPAGAAGGIAGRGQYGGGAAGFAAGQNAGAGFHAGKWAGPNGGNFQTAGASGYQRGVGAFRQSGWSGKAANGASGSGNVKNYYNAQTGQGTRSSNEQVQNAAGQDYGYNGNTSYTKGQGANSVIQTDNHGTYDVNYQKGQKPVVTETSTTSQ